MNHFDHFMNCQTDLIFYDRCFSILYKRKVSSDQVGHVIIIHYVEKRVPCWDVFPFENDKKKVG